ncbi:MAG: hypothetical protein J0L75_08745 [Spirochaetes bacterium]|nr:hypothetical protein [Spirochaetota bacterium]
MSQLVEGTAEIPGTNIREGFDRARKAAFLLAREKTAEGGTLASGKPADAYQVVRYELLGESQAGKLAWVKIRAEVGLAATAETLQIPPDLFARYRLLVLTDEPSIETGRPLGQLKSLLEDSLLKAGFRLVDRRAGPPADAAFPSTPGSLEALSRTFGDDLLVIVGKASATEQSMRGIAEIPQNFKSARVSVAVSAIVAADGTVMASVSTNTSGAGLGLEAAELRALRVAFGGKVDVARGLISGIAATWGAWETNGFEYMVVFPQPSGSTDMKIEEEIRKLSDKIKGAQEISPSPAGTRAFRVRFIGTRAQFEKVLTEGKPAWGMKRVVERRGMRLVLGP